MTATHAFILDETLFRFTGCGGIVRKVPYEEAGDGYQALPSCCYRSTDDPFLVYTGVHNTSGNLGESTQTAQVVNEWADLVLGRENRR